LLKRRVDNDGCRVVHLARPDGTLEQFPLRDLVMGREVRTLPSDNPAGRPTALPSQRGNLAPQTELDLISEEDQELRPIKGPRFRKGVEKKIRELIFQVEEDFSPYRRPGKLIVPDTHGWGVKVRDGLFGEPMDAKPDASRGGAARRSRPSRSAHPRRRAGCPP
jgi:hypothetical protein